MKTRITMILLFLVGMSSLALAYNNTYAIIIGVADYKNFAPGKGDLNYTVKDASSFAAFLKSKNGGSVPASNIILLTNTRKPTSSLKVRLCLEKRKKTIALSSIFRDMAAKAVSCPMMLMTGETICCISAK